MKTKLANQLLAKVSALVAFSAVIFSTTVMSAEETFQDASSKTVFPKEVSFDIGGTKHTLQATGASTRVKFFVKVYALASYVENPVKTNVDALVNQILDGNPARQFTLHWLRDVEAEKIKSGFIEGLQKMVSPEQFTAFNDATTKYLSVYDNGVKNDDVIILRWLPDGTLLVMKNDKVTAEIKDNAFARAVWYMSVGPNSVVKRNELFSLIFPK
jgi:hypothetical protein